MSIPFYRAFEDRYRGSRDLIQGRLQVYVPFLKPLCELYSEPKAVDLGCGRGEWLEILLRNRFDPLGVDLDSSMLEACQRLGLPTKNGDALQILRDMDDESIAIISGFHIAEHLPFEYLKELLGEVLRVLKPAGLLILETPNAENLTVGTHTFYLDPTHERPIPHLLLSFLTEYCGFSRHKLLRLQEPRSYEDGAPVDLMAVIHGVSPDYAIIAQKNGLASELEIFNDVFEQEYGLSLESLALSYDTRQRGFESTVEKMSAQLKDASLRIELAESRYELAESRHELAESRYELLKRALEDAASSAAASEARMSQAMSYIHSVRLKVDKVLEEETRQAHEREIGLQSMVDTLKTQLDESLDTMQSWRLLAEQHERRVGALLGSSSWRITHPIRVLNSSVRYFAKAPIQAIKRLAKNMIGRAIGFVLRKPFLKARFQATLKSCPNMEARLRKFAVGAGVIDRNPYEVAPPIAPNEASGDGFATASPKVAHIYSELKSAFESKETL